MQVLPPTQHIGPQSVPFGASDAVHMLVPLQVYVTQSVLAGHVTVVPVQLPAPSHVSA